MELGARVRLGSPVHEIASAAHGVSVTTGGKSVRAGRVIVALPPALAAGIGSIRGCPVAGRS